MNTADKKPFVTRRMFLKELLALINMNHAIKNGDIKLNIDNTEKDFILVNYTNNNKMDFNQMILLYNAFHLERHICLNLFNEMFIEELDLYFDSDDDALKRFTTIMNRLLMETKKLSKFTDFCFKYLTKNLLIRTSMVNVFNGKTAVKSLNVDNPDNLIYFTDEYYESALETVSGISLVNFDPNGPFKHFQVLVPSYGFMSPTGFNLCDENTVIDNS